MFVGGQKNIKNVQKWLKMVAKEKNLCYNISKL